MTLKVRQAASLENAGIAPWPVLICRRCSIGLLPLADSCRLSTVALSSTKQMPVDELRTRLALAHPYHPILLQLEQTRQVAFRQGGKLTLQQFRFRFDLRLAQPHWLFYLVFNPFPL